MRSMMISFSQTLVLRKKVSYYLSIGYLNINLDTVFIEKSLLFWFIKFVLFKLVEPADLEQDPLALDEVGEDEKDLVKKIKTEGAEKSGQNLELFSEQALFIWRKSMGESNIRN